MAAAIGVTDDDSGGDRVAQPLRADIDRERSCDFGMAVPSADRDAAFTEAVIVSRSPIWSATPCIGHLPTIRGRMGIAITGGRTTWPV
jgi:hypothetical protein